VLDEAAVSYQIILTKTDKLKPTQIQTVTAEIMEQVKIKKYVAAYPYLIATSSRTGDGIDLVKAEIAALALASTKPLNSSSASNY
jgi:GTP-binding protein